MSITRSQALGTKQTNLLLRRLRLARTHSSISFFAKKGGSSCWTHMVATDPSQYVPSKSCRCSAEGVGTTLFIFKQPWHRPFSEAKKSVPTPQMSREPLCPPSPSHALLPCPALHHPAHQPTHQPNLTEEQGREKEGEREGGREKRGERGRVRGEGGRGRGGREREGGGGRGREWEGGGGRERGGDAGRDSKLFMNFFALVL